MRKFTLLLAATSQVLLTMLPLAGPTVMPQAREYSDTLPDIGGERGYRHSQCMSQSALRRFVGAQGYTDIAFQSQQDRLWQVVGTRGNSRYLVIVNPCGPGIVSQSRIGGA